MKYKRYVLDTSAFTGLGESKAKIERHIKKLIEIVSKSKKKAVSFYMPPSAWEELVNMLERKRIPGSLISRLDAWTIQKAPSLMELNMPSEFLYQYIIHLRERVNRGLREAAKAVLKTKHKPGGTFAGGYKSGDGYLDGGGVSSRIEEDMLYAMCI